MQEQEESRYKVGIIGGGWLSKRNLEWKLEQACNEMSLKGYDLHNVSYSAWVNKYTLFFRKSV